jgi:ribosome biogenesis GTPase
VTETASRTVGDNAEVQALAELGWDAGWKSEFEHHWADELVPARVAAQHRGTYDVLTAAGEARARISGRLRHEAELPGDLPVVGDWVALAEDEPGRATINAVLPRRTKVSRLAAHDPGSDLAREQVVAANVDVIFITTSLAEEPDLRMLERYLALAWESGARPVILLTKADLESDPESVAREVASLGGEVSVHAVSSRSGLGLDAVRSYLAPGATASLLGPSGVGKSTLVNTLAGEKILATRSVREDGTGLHTTTRRQLIVLPRGGLVIDNPGMRELQLWLAEGGLGDTFHDITELERKCRFADCRHETEPGCAVQAALADGLLDPERWRHYRELERELSELEDRLARRERSRARRRRPSAGAS